MTPIHGPTTGIFLANPSIVPKKSPNKIMIPYSSTKKPTNAQRIRMRNRPRKKAAVPLSFCLRAKKARVFWGPIMRVRPIRKRICEKGIRVSPVGHVVGFGHKAGNVHCPLQAWQNISMVWMDWEEEENTLIYQKTAVHLLLRRTLLRPNISTELCAGTQHNGSMRTHHLSRMLHQSLVTFVSRVLSYISILDLNSFGRIA